jgi:hypothetical protein
MTAQPETTRSRATDVLGPFASSPRQRITRTSALPIIVACGAFLLLYARSLVGPVVFFDDFQILTQSWTWERTRDGLWVPQNEHAMPLGRLLTFGLAGLAGRLPFLPIVTCLVGPLALALALALVYIFVRRETGHSFYALLALVLFGVTTVYHQAVWWFAASFAILALDTMLLGLLAAQRWRQTGRGIYLDLTVLACLLAPGWFAIGILAGPLCFLYLLPSDKKADLGRSRQHWSFLPLVGTALFLAVSLPRTAQTILHLGHYGEKDAVQAFGPLIGLGYTARSIVDNLLLGVVGVTDVALPLWCVVPVLLGIVLLGVWWWRQAHDRRLMLLGLGLIGSSYLLIYSARSTWPYWQMVEPAFARYHLLPHLGLVLFFCGGLPGRAGRWFTPAEDGTVSAPQRRFVLTLIGVCFLVQLPRGLICGSPTDWHQFQTIRDQLAVLRRIEEVDARCREHHISAAAAREALGKLEMPCSLGVIDGWEFLRGSDNPRPLPPEEVKRLLEVP